LEKLGIEKKFFKFDWWGGIGVILSKNNLQSLLGYGDEYTLMEKYDLDGWEIEWWDGNFIFKSYVRE
jgi:hypothetical protein